MIELHQYPAVWGLTSLSPFCIKVEVFLRASGLPYKTVEERNPARGPKGKMPFIRTTEGCLADSTLILEELVRSHKLQEFVAQSPLEQAQSLAFQRLIEENLYFVLLYSRWVDPAGWKIVKQEFEGMFPPLLGSLVLAHLRRRLRKQAHAQGIGRHTLEEVYAIGKRDLGALSDFLEQKHYFMGAQFTVIDASLFAFLITILRQPIESELKKSLKSFGNLLAYSERLEQEFSSFKVHNQEIRV